MKYIRGRGPCCTCVSNIFINLFSPVCVCTGVECLFTVISSNSDFDLSAWNYYLYVYFTIDTETDVLLKQYIRIYLYVCTNLFFFKMECSKNLRTYWHYVWKNVRQLMSAGPKIDWHQVPWAQGHRPPFNQLLLLNCLSIVARVTFNIYNLFILLLLYWIICEFFCVATGVAVSTLGRHICAWVIRSLLLSSNKTDICKLYMLFHSICWWIGEKRLWFGAEFFIGFSTILHIFMI